MYQVLTLQRWSGRGPKLEESTVGTHRAPLLSRTGGGGTTSPHCPHGDRRPTPQGELLRTPRAGDAVYALRGAGRHQVFQLFASLLFLPSFPLYSLLKENFHLILFWGECEHKMYLIRKQITVDLLWSKPGERPAVLLTKPLRAPIPT